MAVIELDAGDFLIFDEPDIVTNPSGAHGVDFYLIVDSAKIQYILESVTDEITFNDFANVDFSIHSVSTSDYLELRDSVGRGPLLEVVDLYFVWEESRLIETGLITDELTLTEIVSVDLCRAGSDTIEYTDTADVIGIWARPISDEFTMTEYAHVFIVDSKYVPLISLVSLTGPNAPEC